MAVPAGAVVVEVLNSSNYADWSVLVRTYLLAQDLWDVVEEEEEEEEEADDKFKAWRKKNATALHAIQTSCGREAFSLIRNTTSAKHGWDTLAEMFKPKPRYYNDYNQYKPLFDAVWSGDSNKATEFLTLHPNAVRARIPSTNSIALHMATELEHEHIVEELVRLMSEEDLEITDNGGWTALSVAANRGNLKMVECMVRKSKKILSIPTTSNQTPIILASINEQWDVVYYLYSVTPLQDLMPEKGPYGAGLLLYYIVGMKFGIALELIQRCPQLVFTEGHNGAFPMQGFMPSAFPSGTRLKFWQRWIYNCIQIERASNDIRVSVQNEGNEECNQMKITWSGINRIREMKQAHIQSRELLHHMCEVIKHPHCHDYVLPAIFKAIERGMFEFTDSVLQARPDLMWIPNQTGRVPFQFAIECRQEKIYSLIYRLNKRKRTLTGNLADMSDNCALHVAGMLSPLAKLNNISGAALQMQREVQWFKEVETLVLPRIKESINYDGMTPRELFTKNHKVLVKEGERWMKGTASSCTVVGALIITIMFAAAFTIPGENNGETGFPIFLHKKLFMAFIVADAIYLFSSTTSVLMFLGILTSRYAEEDFLKSLPTKMIIGLSTLFISIATMMVAFSSALFIMIHEQSWIVIPTIVLASIPVTLFIWMQFPLLVEMYISTYGRGIFDRKVKSRA
ncbi:uncharacterized protein LOC18787954 isoform X2 [Prunus persica]|uniref:uncharacterized protein LOC18787954 isoform X2 n=1 Tax=Prunus persica TaxID=3760 RepID=UPI0009AB8FE7|nr:uncharacterized protein LOC18787954 isoform X2 [Prunus persica]